MLIIDKRENIDPRLLDQMHQMRSESFAKRLNWNVNDVEGYEKDEFDDMNPIYIIGVHNGEVVSSLRLLETMGPHMLSRVFPDLVPDGRLVRSPSIYESTRFCVKTNFGKKTSRVHEYTAELIEGLSLFSHQKRLSHIITVVDLVMMRVLKRAGCDFFQYGKAVKYDDRVKTVAAMIRIGADTNRSIRDRSPLGEMPLMQGSLVKKPEYKLAS